MIPGSATPFLLAKSGDGEYKIERSLRFERAHDSYLLRTPSSAGNRKTWTFSCWAKLTEVGTNRELFVGGGSPWLTIQIANNDKFYVSWTAGQSGTPWQSDALFRDPSAWYHFVVAWDTTQSTAANRLKVYANGVQLTGNNSYPSQNTDYQVNSTAQHGVGGWKDELSGYLADVHFIDGKALAPTDFGEFDSNNVWQPKEYTGGYDVTGGTTVAAATGAEPILNTSDDYGKTISSGVRSDSNSSHIVLAAPLNGSNGGTTITDYHHTIKGSGSAKTISIYTGSASGGAVTSTAQDKYYGSSFYAVRGATNNYSASDYIYRDGDSDLDLGTGSFCVEFWYYPTSLTSNSGIFDNRHPSTSWPNDANGFALVTTGNGSIFSYSGGNQIINHSSKLTANQWHHIAYTRDGSTERLFVNGDFFSSTASSSRNYNRQRFYLGSTANNGEGSDGYYSDLRIYKGVAKYTANFTVPDKPAGGVNQFHLKFNDNSTNAALGTDSSGSNNTWTVNNISAIDAVGSIYAEFSGSSNQYLRNNSGNVLPGSNGAFTIECHFYPHTTNVIGLFDGGSGQTSIIRNYGNNTIEKQSGGSVNFAGDYTQNAWNHIAVVYTGSTSNDRLIVYVNGVESGYAGGLNGFTPGSTFDIGTINNGGDGRFDGYIRNFRVTHAVVYSSAFTPPSHTDNLSAITDTKVLVLTTPALGLTGAGSGTTLGMSNNGSVSSGTLTPASETDSVIDTPTDYETGSGNNAGNYCTLSPLKNAQTLSNGNLDVVGGSSWQRSVGTIGMHSGKYYWEYKITASNEHIIGVGPVDMQLSGNLGAGSPSGSGYGTELGQVNGTGANGSWSNTGASGAGDIIGIAFDADNGNMYVYKNGTALNSGTASHTGLTMPQIPVVSLNGSSRSGTVNFGQRPFTYTPPTGYKSLCTTNLPEPTIADGSTAMDVVTYSGDGTNGRDITGINHSPDLVWIKARNQTDGHMLFDIVRGATKLVKSNNGNAELTESNSLTAFNSDGFTVGNNSSSAQTNASGFNYVAWNWDAGSSNTTVAVDANGSGLPGAECEYRANPSTGFSIVRVANPTSTQARVHGLNKKPDMIVCKSTGSSDSWHTYHSSLGYTKYINMNGNGGATSSDQFGSQEPTSTYFYVKSNTGSGANKSGGMIYYIWTAVEGYSAFGSYTGNGSSDGTYVFTGFRPAFVLIKRTDTSENWEIRDSTRNPHNRTNLTLFPHTSGQEDTGSVDFDFLSNGFKLRNTNGSTNASGGTYMYAAFAEHPFKSARAR